MNIWQEKKIDHTADGETRLNWTPPISGGVQTIYVMLPKMRAKYNKKIEKEEDNNIFWCY